MWLVCGGVMSTVLHEATFRCRNLPHSNVKSFVVGNDIVMFQRGYSQEETCRSGKLPPSAGLLR